MAHGNNWIVKKDGYEADTLALQTRTALGWLPLLEQAYPVFRAQVVAGLQRHVPDSSETLATFPLKDLLRLALTSASAYWVELALAWAVYDSVDEEMRALFSALMVDKTLPQRVRHQAKRLLYRRSIP